MWGAVIGGAFGLIVGNFVGWVFDYLAPHSIFMSWTAFVMVFPAGILGGCLGGRIAAGLKPKPIPENQQQITEPGPLDNEGNPSAK